MMTPIGTLSSLAACRTSVAACGLVALMWVAAGCGDDGVSPPTGDAGGDLGAEFDAGDAFDGGGELDAGPTMDAGTEADAGLTMDAGTEADAGPAALDGAVPGDVRLVFTLPATEPFYTRSRAVFQLVALGGPVDEVQLWRDGAIFAVITAPFMYAWDAALEPEGTYVFEARALRSGVQVATATRTVISDRTAPRIVLHTPALGSAHALDQSVEVEFSEPLLPTSVHALSASFDVTPPVLGAPVMLSADGRTISFIPTANPPYPATATLRLTADLTDRAGNPLRDPTTGTLTYAAWRTVEAPTLAGETMRFEQDILVHARDGHLWAPIVSTTSSARALGAFDGANWTAIPLTVPGYASGLAPGSSGIVAGYSEPAGYRVVRMTESSTTELGILPVTGSGVALAETPTGVTYAWADQAGVGMVVWRREPAGWAPLTVQPFATTVSGPVIVTAGETVLAGGYVGSTASIYRLEPDGTWSLIGNVGTTGFLRLAAGDAGAAFALSNVSVSSWGSTTTYSYFGSTADLASVPMAFADTTTLSRVALATIGNDWATASASGAVASSSPAAAHPYLLPGPSFSPALAYVGVRPYLTRSGTLYTANRVR